MSVLGHETLIVYCKYPGSESLIHLLGLLRPQVKLDSFGCSDSWHCSLGILGTDVLNTTHNGCVSSRIKRSRQSWSQRNLGLNYFGVTWGLQPSKYFRGQVKYSLLGNFHRENRQICGHRHNWDVLIWLNSLLTQVGLCDISTYICAWKYNETYYFVKLIIC